MGTPVGYARCSYKLQRADMVRPSFLTFGVQSAEPDPGVIALTVRGAFAAAGSLASILDSAVTMVETRVALGTASGEDITGFATVPFACTKLQGSPPPNVAVLVHKRTARGGRRGRGRMFLPWACSAGNTGENGQLIASDITAVTNGVQAWFNALAAIPAPLVIIHAPGKTPPGAPNVVTGITIDTLVATQRRRLGR